MADKRVLIVDIVGVAPTPPTGERLDEAITAKWFREGYYPGWVSHEDVAPEHNQLGKVVGLWVNTLLPHLYRVPNVVLDYCHFQRGSKRRGLEAKMENADLVLCSVFACNRDVAKEVIDIVRRCDSRIMIGGLYPTVKPMEVFRALSPDFMVTGDGDRIVTSIVEEVLTQGKTDSPYVVSNIEDVLDVQVSIADIDDMDLDWSFHLKYSALDVQRYMPTMICNRDCKHRCRYCSIFRSGRNRQLPYKKILSQIQSLQNASPRRLHIMFEDPMFFNSTDQLERLLDGMEELHISWQCQNRITANSGQLRRLYSRMQRAGCKTVFLGLESTSPIALAGVNKIYPVLKFEHHYAMIRDAGLLIHTALILGLPTQTESMVHEDVKFVLGGLKKGWITTCAYFPLDIYPGTELGDNPDHFGIIVDSSPRRDGKPFVFSTPHLSRNRLNELYRSNCELLAQAHDET